MRATGTDGRLNTQCKPLAPTSDSSGQRPSVLARLNSGQVSDTLAVNVDPVTG